MASLKRGRGHASDGLKKILVECITTSTSVQYSEDMADTKVNKERIKENEDLLLRLPRKPFVQKTIKKALMELAAQNENKWSLGDDSDLWAERVGKRIRCMQRHISQGLIKYLDKPHPEWLEPFKEGIDDGGGAAEQPGKPAKAQRTKGSSSFKGPSTAPPSSGAAEFVYGFDEDLQSVWRKPAGAPRTARPEYCLKIEAPDDREDHEDSLARWADGHTADVVPINCGETRMRLKEASKGKLAVHWEGKDPEGNDIKLKQVKKKDVSYLTLWKTVDGTSSHVMCLHDYTQAGISFMKELCIEYASGTSKQDCEAEKKLWTKKTKAANSTAAKRPAAAPAAPAAPAAGKAKPVKTTKHTHTSADDVSHEPEKAKAATAPLKSASKSVGQPSKKKPAAAVAERDSDDAPSEDAADDKKSEEDGEDESSAPVPSSIPVIGDIPAGMFDD
eukprot:TRINITY_DN2923_c0_g1_i1.p1 TRINITY_DN2923_c0_g1~~TRINITY_DN2923_c0_g1_i1.p1  ORF type:complete len:487 (+),score=127.62 TRINITY_DN2923_c0_g1_i1:124-1461(+)